VLCASPACRRASGRLTHPEDLVAHRCILIGDQQRAEWRFKSRSGTSVGVRKAGAFITNDGDAACTFALKGAGIIAKSVWDVGQDIEEGRLCRVLHDYAIAAAPLHVIYPNSRNLSPKVRTFTAFLRPQLSAAWRWDTLWRRPDMTAIARVGGAPARARVVRPVVPVLMAAIRPAGASASPFRRCNCLADNANKRV
jgi:hypothetical protein